MATGAGQPVVAHTRSAAVARHCVEYLAERFGFPATPLCKADFYIEGSYPRVLIRLRRAISSDVTDSVRTAAEAYVAGEERPVRDYIDAAYGGLRP